MNRLSFLIIFLFACWSLHAQVILFPGDVNNDGIANHFDILPLGVAHGTKGTPRPAASPDWVPQLQPEPWPENLPVSGINYTFADTDGNGFIDSLDTDVIALNFDSTQNASFPPPVPYLLTDTCFTCPKPGLLITFDRDTAMVTDTFNAFINLIYPPNVPLPAGALGIAFDLMYDPENIKDDLVEVFPDTMPGDLMFVTATPTLARSWRTAEGMIGFGAAGKGQNALFVSRQLGQLKLVVEDMVIRSLSVAVPFWLEVSNILIINDAEQIVCPGPVEVDTITLFDPINAVREMENPEVSVAVFPNPASHFLTIESPLSQILCVQVYDNSGRQISEEKNASFYTSLDVSMLPSGLYFMKIKTASGWIERRFQKK